MDCGKSGCKCGEVAFAATQPRPSCGVATVSCKSDLYAQIPRSYVGGDRVGNVRGFLHSLATVTDFHPQI